MDDGKAPKPTKQPYEKPRLRTIDLAAEEILAAGCKIDVQSAPLQTCFTQTCFDIGS